LVFCRSHGAQKLRLLRQSVNRREILVTSGAEVP
jgi:hypothetical protein